MPSSLKGLTLAVVLSVCLVGLGAGTQLSDPVETTSTADTVSSEMTGRQSTSPEIVQVSNSTNYLLPARETISRQEYARVDIDVGTTMLVDAERIQARHDAARYQQIRERSTGRATTNQQIIARISQRIEQLERRHQRLLRRYSNDEISTQTAVRKLARLEIAAKQQRQFIDRLQGRPVSDQTEIRLGKLSVETALLVNPVSTQIASAADGSTQPVNVYVAGAPESLVAATVVSDTYIRQATLRTQRNQSGKDLFALGSKGRAKTASDRGSRVYSVTGDTARGFTGTHVYEFRANYTGGKLLSYLDGATTNPFHETQRKRPVIDIPVNTTSRASSSFRLNVQHTDPTGPMAVSLLGTGIDSQSEITIYVNEQPIGTITGSGQLWTIQPVGTFTVTATAESGESVSVTVPTT